MNDTKSRGHNQADVATQLRTRKHDAKPMNVSGARSVNGGQGAYDALPDVYLHLGKAEQPRNWSPAWAPLRAVRRTRGLPQRGH